METGSWRGGLAVVLLAVAMAEAGAGGPDCGLLELERELLPAVNALRAAGARCGARAMPPAPPLAWDVSLHAAAARHARDMAARNYFEHRSPEGQGVRDRATASHYAARTLGENIAAGDTSTAEVVRSWMASTQHCENIMDAEFRDVGVACAQRSGTEFGTYWVMVLGRRR